ncbi:hypothetical protein CDL12_20485 [Handroanthus impetiginosus]|uniref:Small auxin-up RNA n=1 Tax=Handroanthus impetiginosus TaxID=429701 RepID=A0A2G9GP12_9LAMI|nr:hypothetical protein CDL12_20485 [Handroanthus impetiginosus]
MAEFEILSNREAGKKKIKKTPKGHIVVYVGEGMKRYVVPISCLKNHDFQKLLEEAAEVYGFYSQGGILLPCNEATFLSVINSKAKS